MPRPHDRTCPHHARPRFERSPILSSSYRNRLARPPIIEEEAPPPPPEHDLEVTGTLNPDATGFYDEGGLHNGQPYYEREDSAWFIWYYHYIALDYHYWRITDELGTTIGARWYKLSLVFTGPSGDYYPTAPATGTATVAPP